MVPFAGVAKTHLASGVKPQSTGPYPSLERIIVFVSMYALKSSLLGIVKMRGFLTNIPTITVLTSTFVSIDTGILYSPGSAKLRSALRLITEDLLPFVIPCCGSASNQSVNGNLSFHDNSPVPLFLMIKSVTRSSEPKSILSEETCNLGCIGTTNINSTLAVPPLLIT